MGVVNLEKRMSLDHVLRGIQRLADASPLAQKGKQLCKPIRSTSGDCEGEPESPNGETEGIGTWGSGKRADGSFKPPQV